jgi:hypothetical protein
MKAQDIIKKYPTYFENCMEFSTGEGWIPIVDMFMEVATNHTQDFEIESIKEKFGFLRINYNFFINCNKIVHNNSHNVLRREFIYGIDAMATKVAENTCEFCGSNDNLGRTSGWIRNICNKCAKKEHRKRYSDIDFKNYWLSKKPLVEQRKDKLNKLV